ncbi:MAG: ATPase [Actinobacteria bacterium]|jgi:glucosamine kinase|nr:MAG: ATPase [Actinomycetota bacterium]
MSTEFVVGLDVGGATTRVTVIGLDGSRLGDGQAGAGNPITHGPELATNELRTALTTALSTVDLDGARAGVISLPGANRLLADPTGRAVFDTVWRDAGLRCPYTVLDDLLVAYASATAAPDGAVVLADLDAVAASIRQMAVDRTADGYGWLLGDGGSAFWLGRAAVRRLLADLDAGQEPSRLASQVLTELLGTAQLSSRPRHTVDRVVQAVSRRPPIELAKLAPLVLTAAQEGDTTAIALVDEAAQRLAATVGRVRGAVETTPVVLGGSLLTDGTVLAAALSAALRERSPHTPLLTAGDGAAAAAWLAARSLDGVDADTLHRRVVRPV